MNLERQQVQNAARSQKTYIADPVFDLLKDDIDKMEFVFH